MRLKPLLSPLTVEETKAQRCHLLGATQQRQNLITSSRTPDCVHTPDELPALLLSCAISRRHFEPFDP